MFDPMTIGMILSAAGIAQNAMTTNRTNVQTPGSVSGGNTGMGATGPFNVAPPMAPVPEIPVLGQPTGVGEILAGTVGFDPSRKQAGDPGYNPQGAPEGTTVDTTKDKLPSTGSASSTLVAKDWDDILKSASLALQNPAVSEMLGFGSTRERRQSAAPIAGGGANPQVLIGQGMGRANIGQLLTQIPRG
jgi:hypothetical protein